MKKNHTPRAKKDIRRRLKCSASGDTKQLQGKEIKDEHMPVCVDNQPVERVRQRGYPMNFDVDEFMEKLNL